MYFIILGLIFCNVVFSSTANEELYPNFNVSVDPSEVQEWSDNPALAYITTVRLFDYDHHVFQYRRYPCQYFYTDEIQLHNNNGTSYQCARNLTTNEYEYSFQLYLDSRHVEPDVLRNKAIQCEYVNCSLSLLNITYLNIGWNLEGRKINPDCSFNIEQPYNIIHTPYPVSEWITLRCKSMSACNQSRSYVEQSFHTYVELIYGSSYELQIPYCSLERSLSYVVNTNFAETNRLLKQVVDLMQRASEKKKSEQ